MIYLAAPYNSNDPEVVEARMKRVLKHLATLNSQGNEAFSPLLMHFCLTEGDLPTDYSFWRGFCRFFLRVSDELQVLTLPGWEDSPGVCDEIQYAGELGVPVKYVV
jgi:hypothetical protein